MSGVFINYRCRHYSSAVEAIAARLTEHFGRDSIFLDVQSIGAGDHYPDQLRGRLLSSDVLLVVIDPDWLASENGERLIDRKHDWVRYEIETALDTGKRVIPVILPHAALPADLPDTIGMLAMAQAVRIRSGTFRDDVTRLVRILEPLVPGAWSPPPPTHRTRPARPRAGLVAGAVLTLLTAPAVLGPLSKWDGVGKADLPAALVASTVLTLGMLGPILALAMLTALQRRINAAKRELHRASVAARAHGLGTPYALALPVLVPVAAASWNPWAATIAGLLLAAHTFWQGVVAIRDEREAEVWPPVQPPGTEPAALRRAVARLQDQYRAWPRPLSRERRDQVCWLLTEIGRGAERLRRDAARGRAAWLCADHPWLTSFYLGWAAAVTGLSVTTGRYAFAAGIVLALCGLCAATVELGYRRARWVRRHVAFEITIDLAVLRTGIAAPVPHLTGAG